LIWYNLELSCQQDKSFEIEEFLLGFGASSVSYTYQNNNEEFYELQPDENPLWDLVKINAIFEKKISRKEIIQILGKSGYSNLMISTFKDRNWVKSYQKNLMPMLFGKRLWIIPSWIEKKHKREEIIIKMDPGMAFGSGTHETTSLCLEYIDSAKINNLSVTDYGCGSGILGIACLLLGAKEVNAVDIDDQALSISMHNAKKNAVHKKFNIFKPKELRDKKTDLLIANIFAKTLIELHNEFLDIVVPNGRIILSGILNHQLDQIIYKYNKQCNLIKILNKNGWYLVEFQKKTNSRKL